MYPEIGILSNNQFEFRKWHSTGHALHHSINSVQDALKQKQHEIEIFLNHEILQTKLEHCGVKGQAHDLLKVILLTEINKPAFSENAGISVGSSVVFFIYIYRCMPYRMTGLTKCSSGLNITQLWFF